MGGTQFAKKSKHRKHKQDILLKIQTLDCLVHYWTITQKDFYARKLHWTHSFQVEKWRKAFQMQRDYERL